MRARSPSSSRCRRRARGACSTSATSRSARRRGRASTASTTATTSCSTSAVRVTCARGSARTSAPTGSGRRSRRRSRAVERIEWRVLGSELEAALEELRLIRELRPPANARVARPDRYVWLRKRGDGVVRVVAATTGRADPLAPPCAARGACAARGRARAAVARAAAPAPPARGARRRAPLRGRGAAPRPAAGARARLPRARAARSACARCSAASSRPAAEPGHARAFFVAGGRVAAERTLPPGGGAHLEIEAGLAAAQTCPGVRRPRRPRRALARRDVPAQAAGRAADRAARARGDPPGRR